MKEQIGRVVRRLAPRTYDNLRLLSEMPGDGGDFVATLKGYEEEVAELRRELNEVRADNRRVTELYDLVIARLHADNPLAAGGPDSEADTGDASRLQR